MIIRRVFSLALLALVSALVFSSCGGGGGGGDHWVGDPYPATVTQIVYSDEPVVVNNPFVVTMTISYTKALQALVGVQITYDANNLTVTVTPQFRDKKSKPGGTPPQPVIKGAVLAFDVVGTWTVKVVHSAGVDTKSVTVTPASL